MSKKYYVALEEDGIPKFSEKPVVHTFEGAQKEAQRLAEKFPGQTFGLYLKSARTNRSFRVEPVTAYTGTELTSTAPAGVYRLANDLGSARFVVQLNDGQRNCYFITGKRVFVMNAETWSTSPFELTSEEQPRLIVA